MCVLCYKDKETIKTNKNSTEKSTKGERTREGLQKKNYPGGGHFFCTPARPAVGPTQPPIHCVPGVVAGGQAAGAWR